MPYYQFVARTGDAQSENLGVMDLRDDGDAVSFAHGIISRSDAHESDGLW